MDIGGGCEISFQGVLEILVVMSNRAQDIDARPVTFFPGLLHPLGQDAHTLLEDLKGKRRMGIGCKESNFIGDAPVLFKQIQELPAPFFRKGLPDSDTKGNKGLADFTVRLFPSGEHGFRAYGKKESEKQKPIRPDFSEKWDSLC